MKSILSNTFALLTLLLLLPATLLAQGLVGECADCHTMHNSEQGQPVAQVGLAGTISNTPNSNLLKYDCIACHAQGGSEKIVGLSGGSQIPQVYHNDLADLAAGNFAYISGFKDGHNGTAGNRKGHNVVDLVSAETDMTQPPGFRHTNSAVGEGRFDMSKFTCAGYMGCHGYRGQVLVEPPPPGDCTVNPITGVDDPPGCSTAPAPQRTYRVGLSALSGFDGFPNASFKRGAHHDNYDGLKNDGFDPNFYDNPLANSYRFIHSLRGYGNEVDRWQNIDENSHNEYVGGYLDNALAQAGKATDYGTTGDCSKCHFLSEINSVESKIVTPGQSTTGLCLTCHGSFHSSGVTNGSSGAFLRHPSDYVIPDRGEYLGYTTYDITAPVARPHSFFGDGMTNSSSVTPGTDLVMCLSCHVAHAAPYDGMLRFDYEAMVAGGYADVGTATAEGGCLACHTTKGVLKQPTP